MNTNDNTDKAQLPPALQEHFNKKRKQDIKKVCAFFALSVTATAAATWAIAALQNVANEEPETTE